MKFNVSKHRIQLTIYILLRIYLYLFSRDYIAIQVKKILPPKKRRDISSTLKQLLKLQKYLL